MESLEVLQLSANPLRSIPQDVLSSGTGALKDLLRDRHEPEKKTVSSQSPIKMETKTAAEPLQSSPYDSLPMLNTSTGVLNWGQDRKQTTANKFTRGVNKDSGDQILPPLDDQDIWKSVVLRGCKPDASVRTIVLSSRQLNQFPLGYGKLIVSLEVVCAFSSRFSPFRLIAFQSSLTVLNLSRNKLTKLPDEIGLLSKLEELDVRYV